MVRNPAVAGMFYPGSKAALKREMARLIDPQKKKRDVIGLISPHAGYAYSGACAAKGFARVRVPGSVVILGINHRNAGHPFAVDRNDFWQTPLGDCPVDTVLRERLTKNSRVFSIDGEAGREEHSVEVQVPFIQTINPETKILPITISSHDLDSLIAGGREIAECLLTGTEKVLVLASTDMSHYIDAETASLEDGRAIDKIRALDPRGLYDIVVERRISMCGMAPTVMMLSAAIEAGATQTEMVEYTHSGKVSGDNQQVVAYLSMLVY